MNEFVEISKTSDVNNNEVSKTSETLEKSKLLKAPINSITSAVTRSAMKSKELDEILLSNVSETSDDIVNKSQSINLINSPPIIRKKPIDRLNELKTNNSKKDINIEMKKKREVTNKISGEIDSYFDSIIR